jgi:hypothetical protein
VVLFIGLIAAPTGLWLLGRERDRTGRPASRLGVIWRFMLYGGLLGAGLAVLFALIQVLIGAISSGSVMQALGSTETILLIYGVGGLPVCDPGGRQLRPVGRPLRRLPRLPARAGKGPRPSGPDARRQPLRDFGRGFRPGVCIAHRRSAPCRSGP